MRYSYNDNEMYNRIAIDSGIDWEERQRRLYKKGKDALKGNVVGLTMQQVINKGIDEDLKEGLKNEKHSVC